MISLAELQGIMKQDGWRHRKPSPLQLEWAVQDESNGVDVSVTRSSLVRHFMGGNSP